MKQVLSVVVALFVVASLSPAHAGGVYYGGSIGQSSADVSSTNVAGSGLSGSVDDSDTFWKVYGGYKIFKYLAVEATWEDLGEVSSAASFVNPLLPLLSGDVSATSESDGYSISTLGTYPFNDKFKVFAKLGYLFWDAKTIVALTGFGLPDSVVSSNDDGQDLILGAGLVWDYTGPGQLRVEYEQADVDNEGVGSFSAGLSFKF